MRASSTCAKQLISLAEFPYVSANVVDADGNTPDEWSPSHVFKFPHGVKVGIVGFSNDDLPTLINPAGLDPFHVSNSTAAVNAEAAKLAKKTDAIVAIGHLGADFGTVTNPTGPAVALADAVGENVDAVIADHTNFQVLTTRPNGVLLTENLSKGVRFTRVRLVIGPGKEGVVYKTADFHKPWTIGVTPDAAIQAKIDRLNGQLAPILGVVIGESNKVITRADQCGRADGRLCESFVGNTLTDALLSKYDTDFALTNSGGLRAALTCPAAGGAGAGFCPDGSTGPPFPITLGAVYGVLPFGNFSVTLRAERSGAEDDVGARCFRHAVRGRALPAGRGALLHLRHRSAGRQSGHGCREGEPRRFVHGNPGRPDRRVDVLARQQRLHAQRRRRVPELQGPVRVGGHPPRGRSRGLRGCRLAPEPGRAGVPERPDQLRGQQRRDRAELPDPHALSVGRYSESGARRVRRAPAPSPASASRLTATTPAISQGLTSRLAACSCGGGT